MDRLKALEREWGDVPTVDQLVAAFLGYKAKKVSDPKELLSMFPGGKIGG